MLVGGRRAGVELHVRRREREQDTVADSLPDGRGDAGGFDAPVIVQHDHAPASRVSHRQLDVMGDARVGVAAVDVGQAHGALSQVELR